VLPDSDTPYFRQFKNIATLTRSVAHLDQQVRFCEFSAFALYLN